MTNQSQKPGQALHEYLQRQVHWKTVGLRLLIGLAVLIAVVWFGRHAAQDLKALEAWIAEADSDSSGSAQPENSSGN